MKIKNGQSSAVATKKEAGAVANINIEQFADAGFDNVDSKSYKWSGTVKLKKIDNNLLPNYVLSNLEKYKNWLD